jgi:DNA-binding HxlR family transcriptional regulator
MVQQLRAGPMRFGEIAHAIPEISAKMLTQELHHLQQQQMIARVGEGHYHLTDAGALALPLITARADVGRAYEARLTGSQRAT